MTDCTEERSVNSSESKGVSGSEPTLFCWPSEEWTGTRPSLSDGLPESLDETLTESMLSPELPVGGDRGVSLTGELAAATSPPRNILKKERGRERNGEGGSVLLENQASRSSQYLIMKSPNLPRLSKYITPPSSSERSEDHVMIV